MAMDISKFVTRSLAVVVIVVVIVSGIVGAYRGFINPKYLKVRGVKVPTQDVMRAYYQMNPGAPKNGHVSRENAIEAFVLRQQLFNAYLDKTRSKSFVGTIIDQKEAYTTEEQTDDRNEEMVRRYLLDIGGDILCVYTKDISKRFPVGTRLKVFLGEEFTLLVNPYQVKRQNQMIHVRFASALVTAQIQTAPVARPVKPKAVAKSRRVAKKPHKK